MDSKSRSKLIKEVLGNPRIQKEEIQALQDSIYVIGTPVTIEYSATDYCYSFGDIILEMIKWGKNHRARIKNARLKNK